ncbi:MAG: TetR/AcrR family transcriptional regulator [Actinomycetota bacterium]|nr:TetR/AcrR family transcriptional regulator [Actinomycetota bacterium]
MNGDAALLDAAVEQFVLTGVRRTSADDIARRAGVNRATLYRRLGTKDQIVAGAILQETSRVLARITDAIGDVPPPGTPGFDPAAYVLTFFSVTIGELRDNRLLQQLMVKDPDDTLVGLTARAGDAIDLAAGLVADRIVKLRAYVGNGDTSNAGAVGHTLARLTQSLLLTPDGPPRLDTAARRKAYVDAVIVPMVLGRAG